MKYVLIGLLVVSLFLISVGYYKGIEFYIGFGVLIICVCVMPIFIYMRYKDKRIEKYKIKDD